MSCLETSVLQIILNELESRSLNAIHTTLKGAIMLFAEI